MSRGAILRAAGAVVLLGCLAVISLPAHPPRRLCGFYWLTGRPCPLCGMTRALFALAKGHWAEAVRLNALSPLGFVMLFSLFWKSPLRTWLWRIGLAAFCVYGAVRLITGA